MPSAPYTGHVLENPRSPRVRAVAKLSKRAARQETGLFLLEGPQAAREALAYAPETVLELYATPTAMEKHTDVREAAERADVEVQYTTEAVLDAMADTVTPQGIIAVARQSPTALKDVLAAGPVSSRSAKRCAIPATSARSSAPRMPPGPTP